MVDLLATGIYGSICYLTEGAASNMQCCLTGVSCSVVKQYIFAIVVLVVVVDKVIN